MQEYLKHQDIRDRHSAVEQTKKADVLSIQFRVEDTENGYGFSYPSIEIPLSTTLFDASSDLLSHYFRSIEEPIPQTSEELQFWLITQIAPDERKNGKGKFSKLNSRTIQSIFDPSINVDIEAFPVGFDKGETKILVLAALCDSNPQSKPRRILQSYIDRHRNNAHSIVGALLRSHDTQSDELSFIVTHLINTQKKRKQAEQLVNSPEKKTLISTEARYQRYLEMILTSAEHTGELPETFTARIRQQTSKLGFVPFLPENQQTERAAIQTNEDETQQFVAILTRLRSESTSPVDQVALTKLLALVHDVTISDQDIEQRSKLINKAYTLPSQELIYLGHKEISLILASGIEIQSRPNAVYTPEEQHIIDLVNRLNTHQFTFIHRPFMNPENHDEDIIHGGYREEVQPDGTTKKVFDPCPVHTPLQDAITDIELQQLTTDIQLFHEQQYQNNTSPSEKKILPPEGIVEGVIKKIETPDAIFVEPTILVVNTTSHTSKLNLFDAPLFVFPKNKIKTIKQPRRITVTKNLKPPQTSQVLKNPVVFQEGVTSSRPTLEVLPSQPLPIPAIETTSIRKLPNPAEINTITDKNKSRIINEKPQRIRIESRLAEALKILDLNKQTTNAFEEIVTTPVIPELSPLFVSQDNSGDDSNLALELPVINSKLLEKNKNKKLSKKTIDKKKTENMEIIERNTAQKTTQAEAHKDARQQKKNNTVVEPMTQAEEGTHEKGRSTVQPVRKKQPLKKINTDVTIKPDHLQTYLSLPQKGNRLSTSHAISTFDPYVLHTAGNRLLRTLAA